jgi:hypothetical protein
MLKSPIGGIENRQPKEGGDHGEGRVGLISASSVGSVKSVKGQDFHQGD